MVDFTLLEKVVSSQFTWAILCLIAVIFFYRKMDANDKKSDATILKLQEDNKVREDQLFALYEANKKEAAQREKRLMDHLERTTDTLQKIETNLTNLENSMDEGFKDIWRQIDQKGGPANA